MGWIGGKQAVTVVLFESADPRWRSEWLCWTSRELSSVGTLGNIAPSTATWWRARSTSASCSCWIEQIAGSSSWTGLPGRWQYQPRSSRVKLIYWLVNTQNFSHQVQHYNIRGCLNIHHVQAAVVSHGEHFGQTRGHIRGGELTVNWTGEIKTKKILSRSLLLVVRMVKLSQISLCIKKVLWEKLKSLKILFTRYLPKIWPVGIEREKSFTLLWVLVLLSTKSSSESDILYWNYTGTFTGNWKADLKEKALWYITLVQIIIIYNEM